MERSAAALKAGGNTLNESLGLITAGNLIQQDATTTAAALKTMSLRIRGSKTELEEMGEETDGMVESTAKLRKEIKSLSGVDIMADEDTFKSTAEIIKELGAVYEGLTDIKQAGLLELIAGKNRASTVAGLLENYELIDEVIQSAENADGSALRENEAYLDSIDGKIDQLTNSVQRFWSVALETDTVKTVLSFLTDLLNKITDLVDLLGTVPSIGGIVGTIVGLRNISKGGGRAKKYVKLEIA